VDREKPLCHYQFDPFSRFDSTRACHTQKQQPIQHSVARVRAVGNAINKRQLWNQRKEVARFMLDRLSLNSLHVRQSQVRRLAEVGGPIHHSPVHRSPMTYPGFFSREGRFIDHM